MYRRSPFTCALREEGQRGIFASLGGIHSSLLTPDFLVRICLKLRQGDILKFVHEIRMEDDEKI